MGKRDIIARLARGRVAEKIARNIVNGRGLPFDLAEDIAQDVYVVLLCYQEDVIAGLEERGQVEFFIAKIITNQVAGRNTKFANDYGRWLDKALPLLDGDTNEEED